MPLNDRENFARFLAMSDAEREEFLPTLPTVAQDRLRELLQIDSAEPIDQLSPDDRYARAMTRLDAGQVPVTETVTGYSAAKAGPYPEMIGRYRVISCLGSGGQGSVYRAIHPTLGHDVAVKLSHQKVNADEREPLEAEARLLAGLSHPQVARIYDCDFHDGCPYLVMEYLEGQSLEQALQTRHLAETEIRDILRVICQTMQYVHAQGILHLDLKPDNIILTANDGPKLIDFGMARLRRLWHSDTTDNLGGTIAYMSPEQAAAFPLPDEAPVGDSTLAPDRRADIFSIGAILYRCLTGDMLYQCNSVSQGIEQARSGRWDRRKLKACGAPAPLRDLAVQALQVDREARIRSCEEMLPLLSGPQLTLTARIMALVGTGAVLLILFAVYESQFKQPESPSPEPAPSANSQSPVLEGDRPVDAGPVSPDGGAQTAMSVAENSIISVRLTLYDESRVSRDLTPAHLSDMQYHATFTEPLYCALLELTTHGKVQVKWPPEELSMPVAPQNSLTFPPEEGSYIYLDDPPGQIAYFTLLSRKPLPAPAELQEILANIQPKALAPGGFFKLIDGRLPPPDPNETRSSTRTLPGFAEFRRICTKLKEVLPEVTVHGMTFPVKPLPPGEDPVN